MTDELVEGSFLSVGMLDPLKKVLTEENFEYDNSRRDVDFSSTSPEYQTLATPEV